MKISCKIDTKKVLDDLFVPLYPIIKLFSDKEFMNDLTKLFIEQIDKNNKNRIKDLEPNDYSDSELKSD